MKQIPLIAIFNFIFKDVPKNKAIFFIKTNFFKNKIKIKLNKKKH